MAIDVEALLAPVPGNVAVGEDLSYDAERQQIELAFETPFGGDDAADDVDWRSVIQLIEAQSARTKDIWLAVYLTRAGARSGQIDVAEAGAQYLAGLVETYWETLHPQLDEYGFQGRKGPCEGLTRIAEFLGPLDRTVLLRHPRLGTYSGRDFKRFADRGAEEDGYGMFRAALEDVGVEGLREVLDRLDRLRDGIRRTDAVLVTNAGSDTGTNFTPTYDLLESLRRSVAQFAPAIEEAEPVALDEPEGEEGIAAESGSTRRQAAFGGRIDSREAVLKAFDAIADYYRRSEPGSPVPLLLSRAREWVNADFLTILEDLSASSVTEVSRVLFSQRSNG